MNHDNRKISRFGGSFRTLLAILTVGTLVLALGPLTGIASATDGTLDARSILTACENAPEAALEDDVESQQVDDAVDCLAAEAYGSITEGTDDGDYDPGETVPRAPMAGFIARLLQAANVELPAEPADAFADDETENSSTNDPDDGIFFELQINQLAELGVVQGTDADSYSPFEEVSREQMATFIRNALEEAGADVPEPEGNPFGDAFLENCFDGHEPNVLALASNHVVEGTADGDFGCKELVTRGQMALFLARGLDVLAEQGIIVNPFFEDPEAQSFDVQFTQLNDSDATGLATVVVNEDGSIDVNVEVQDAEDNVHPQHIHAFEANVNGTCPTEAEHDENDDGFISVGEGAPAYGPVALPLDGTDDAASDLDSFPTGSTYSYTETFSSNAALADIRPLNDLENRVIVIHGKTVDGEYVPTAPILCGQLEPTS